MPGTPADFLKKMSGSDLGFCSAWFVCVSEKDERVQNNLGKYVCLGPRHIFQRKCRGPNLGFLLALLVCVSEKNDWVQIRIIFRNVCAWDPGRFFKENAGVRSWIFVGLACLCFRN